MHKQIFLSTIGLLFLTLGFSSASSLDSLRVEYIDGKAYIIHEVDPGETLYSISKRYKSSMNAIAEATPAVKKGLHDGMILQIPYKPQVSKTLKQQIHVVTQGETLYSISRIYDISVVEIMEWNDLLSSELEIGQELKIGGESQPQKIDYVLDGMRIHVVQAGEGLYVLARNFEVTVDELVAWNELESSSLNLGQEVIVGKITETAEEDTLATTDSVAVPVAAPAVFVPMEKVYENGMAAIIEGESEESFLAMHREIPVGSIVAVRNEMNNQVVFVRIVGKLPDTGVNDKVIIRLSPGAVKQLQAIDPKFRVELSYLVPQ
jgi:LysM repeat protein